MIVFPNAKINIGLNVTRKRPDGYHAIESIFYPVPLKDALEAIRSETVQFECYGASLGQNPNENTILQAYEILKTYRDLQPVHFYLLKAIPQEAGLGGGSADGTFAITLLNELLNLQLTNNELQAISEKIGSDCPFFLTNQPQYVSGRGETMDSIDLTLTGYHYAIIHPAISISTGEAYQNMQPAKPGLDLRKSVKEPIDKWPDFIHNDFEDYVLAAYPEIEYIKERLYEAGALFASLTGSGSAVYGIFREAPVMSHLFPENYQIFTGAFD